MTATIIERFKDSYRDMTVMDISKLDQLYTENVVFKDPVHEVRGLVSMQDYLAAMCANVSLCRFEYLDQLESEQAAYLKWNMHFCHPRLEQGRLVTVRGISHIYFDELINYHEDVYDMGQMLYEHVPVIGGLTRWLKKRLTC